VWTQQQCSDLRRCATGGNKAPLCRTWLYVASSGGPAVVQDPGDTAAELYLYFTGYALIPSCPPYKEVGRVD